MTGCSISDEWAFRDIKATILENDELRVVVLPGKGTDISEISFKPMNMNLLFRNPWGPRAPKRFPNVSPHEETFRDYTGGGWSDILPNAGAPCEVDGARFGLHDETPLLSWSSKVEDESGANVSALFETRLRKYPFKVTKKVGLDTGNTLTITETVLNDSEVALPFSWLCHPTFSHRFADESARLEVSALKISEMEGVGEWTFPRFTDVDGTERDIRDVVVPPGGTALDNTLVLSGLGTGCYSLLNPRLSLRFTLSWDEKVFPYLWFYRSLNAPGYPYYGRSRFVALEPCTSKESGLAAQIDAGDARILEAGASLTTSFTAKVERGPVD